VVGVLLPAFHKRVSEMAYGSAETEWPEFRDVDLNGAVMVPDAEERNFVM